MINKSESVYARVGWIWGAFVGEDNISKKVVLFLWTQEGARGPLDDSSPEHLTWAENKRDQRPTSTAELGYEYECTVISCSCICYYSNDHLRFDPILHPSSSNKPNQTPALTLGLYILLAALHEVG